MSKKVLIADDEQNIVISVEFLLKREGFTVSVAGDGEEALAKVRADRPDLVVLDVMMPKKTGFEVCQEMRVDAALKHVRVLMLTAKGREEERQKGAALLKGREHCKEPLRCLFEGSPERWPLLSLAPAAYTMI